MVIRIWFLIILFIEENYVRLSLCAEEKLKTIRKVRGCSVRVKRCLSISLDDPESDLVVACKKETVSVAGEVEQNPAAEVKLDDEEDVKDDKTGIEQLQQSTEDPNSEGSPVKRVTFIQPYLPGIFGAG